MISMVSRHSVGLIGLETLSKPMATLKTLTMGLIGHGLNTISKLTMRLI